VSKAFLSRLAIAISAVVVGIAIGYYAGITGATPISSGIVGIIGLMLAGLLGAFYGGRVSGRADRPAPSLQRSWDAFRRELDRARRFERTFVLVRIPLREKMRADDFAVAIGAHGTLPLLVRSIDQVWAMDDSIYMVLPESTRAMAHELIARLRVAMPSETALNHAEMVEFPHDGVTTGALVANLRPIEPSDVAAPVRLKLAEPAAGPDRSERTG
jgi:hypothetical protein